jgi:hypothetical protein
MDIRLNTTFTLFQPGRETLSPSYFLLHFVDVDQDEQRFAIVQNEGEARGPLLFRVTEMEAGNPTLGQVQLYAANWHLTVYEQSSATNQDIANAGRKVWSELIGVCEDADVPAREPYDPCIGCGEGPCPPTTVNGTESDTPTITVVQGGEQVGRLNPATGVHTVPECEECDPQLELRLNGGAVYKTLDLDCGLQGYNNVVTYPNGTEVGEWNPEEDRIEVPAPILCEQCPLDLVINGDPFATVANPCDDPTLSIQVRQSTGSTQVGSQQGSHWRIDDSEISINGTVVADVMAEDSLNIPVVQGGSPVGSWNGTQWVVPPCDTLCELLGDVLPADVQDDILDCVTEATEDAIRDILAPPGDAIIYNIGRSMFSGQETVYRTGDEGSMFAAGFFTYNPTIGPNSVLARLVDFTTLAQNNLFGNTLRFTDRTGAAAASSGNRFIQDHYVGVEYYVLNTWLTAADWNAAVDAGVAINATLGETGWFLPNDRLIDNATNDNSAAFASGAPFSMPLTGNTWTSSTQPGNTAAAKFLGLVGGQVGANVKITAGFVYGIFVRRFI